MALDGIEGDFLRDFEREGFYFRGVFFIPVFTEFSDNLREEGGCFLTEPTFPQFIHPILVCPLHGFELRRTVEGVPQIIFLIDDVVVVLAQEDKVWIIVSVFIRDAGVRLVTGAIRIERLDMADIREVSFQINETNGATRKGTAVP